MSGAAEFLKARDCLLSAGGEYQRVRKEFSWPKLDRFNWALDYFDLMAAANSGVALSIIEENDIRRAELNRPIEERNPQEFFAEDFRPPLRHNEPTEMPPGD
jgi:acetyl-CoA synthetase